MIDPKQVLTFDQLRDANRLRLPTFKNAKGEPYHKPDGSDWTISEWVAAMAGEIGEAANIVKKAHRGDFTLSEIVRDLMDELADVQIYLDIVAYRLGVDIFAGRTFDQLRSATMKDYRNQEKRPSVLSHFDQLIRYAGDLAFIASEISNGRLSVTKAKKKSEQYVLHTQRALDRIAYSASIDLGKATVIKFNAVSARVGSPVFIDLSGLGYPTKCKACSHVFKLSKKNAQPHLRYEDSYWSHPCHQCGEVQKVMMVPGEAIKVASRFK